VGHRAGEEAHSEPRRQAQTGRRAHPWACRLDRERILSHGSHHRSTRLQALRSMRSPNIGAANPNGALTSAVSTGPIGVGVSLSDAVRPGDDPDVLHLVAGERC
jgi:hypothetical protein